MNSFSHVPPGFRFHPTDEELVDYYLRKKVNSTRIDLDVIKDVDLYKIEPWDLQEVCRVGREEQDEWYFFSHKDKKYPTGTRTNRATAAGFWKATGRDKAIYSKHDLIGMRKTLVFYKGRAPNGQKSDWIMHEYRLETDELSATPQEEGWVVCRVFKKRIPTMRKMMSEHDSPCSSTWYDHHHHHHDQLPFMQQQQQQDFDSSSSQTTTQPNLARNSYMIIEQQHAGYVPEQRLPLIHFPPQQLPLLQNPNNNIPMATYENHGTMMIQEGLVPQTGQQQSFQAMFGNNNTINNEVADWRVLDHNKFVSSQLISQQDHVSKDNNNSANEQQQQQFKDWDKQESSIIMPENASTSNSSCPMDMWK